MTLDDYEYDERLHALCQPPAPDHTWVTRALLLDGRLSAPAFVAGAILASYLQSGEPLPDATHLARQVPCSPRTLRQALAELEAAGWIRRRVTVP